MVGLTILVGVRVDLIMEPIATNLGVPTRQVATITLMVIISTAFMIKLVKLTGVTTLLATLAINRTNGVRFKKRNGVTFSTHVQLYQVSDIRRQ